MTQSDLSYSKVRLKVQSFNHETLDLACKEIVQFLEKYSIPLEYYILLPTTKKIYCVLRSPHVDKDSREHFEIRIHKRIFELYVNSDNEIFEKLKKLNFKGGVLCEVKF